jgi:hypothetical protein
VYRTSQYNRAFVSTIAHRQFAKQAAVATAMKAGQALADPETAAHVRTEAYANRQLPGPEVRGHVQG